MRVGADEPACPEFFATEIADNNGKAIAHILSFKHCDDWQSRCARRLAIVRTLLRARRRENVGIAYVGRLSVFGAKVRQNLVHFFHARNIIYKGIKLALIHFKKTLSNRLHNYIISLRGVRVKWVMNEYLYVLTSVRNILCEIL